MRLLKRWLLAAALAFAVFLAALYGATNFYIRHYGGAGFERASGANVAAIVVGFGVAIPAALLVFFAALYFFHPRPRRKE